LEGEVAEVGHGKIFKKMETWPLIGVDAIGCASSCHLKSCIVKICVGCKTNFYVFGR